MYNYIDTMIQMHMLPIQIQASIIRSKNEEQINKKREKSCKAFFSSNFRLNHLS